MQKREMMKVRVLRAFFYQRHPGEQAEALKQGTVVELPKLLAVEMCAARKAEEVEEKTPTPASKTAEKGSEKDSAGKAGKGGGDAK